MTIITPHNIFLFLYISNLSAVGTYSIERDLTETTRTAQKRVQPTTYKEAQLTI